LWGIAAVVLVLAIVAVVALAAGWDQYGAITGKVADAMSGDPVYDVYITAGGKSIIRYEDPYYRLSGLSPGTHTLKATAPSYEPVEKKVVVRRGRNVVDLPMVGKEIPGLKSIIAWADPEKDKGILLEIRFVNEKEEGIVHFPRLPISGDGKLFYRIGSKDNYAYGDLLWAGPLEFHWDSKEFLGKNKALIPKEAILPGMGSAKIAPSEKSYGILEVVLKTPHGNFNDKDWDVQLNW